MLLPYCYVRKKWQSNEIDQEKESFSQESPQRNLQRTGELVHSLWLYIVQTGFNSIALR